MTDETPPYGERLRDLEAFAFRTRNALTEHRQPPPAMRQRQRPHPGSIEQRLDTIERVLFALARTQGIDPAPTE
jgi:hypothetical protein